ncbi:60S ribosomal protein L39 [Cladobotryum mycophilum]|uniref:Large ribosomal subunit protein eL39 n=1 Tax=Cladobotryum mycophilum TaxID=491253 RepID=A0ABR0SEP7_9HYPO
MPVCCPYPDLFDEETTALYSMDFSAHICASHKSFRTKQKLAKAQKQNRPVPQWIRLRTGNTIRCVETIPAILPSNLIPPKSAHTKSPIAPFAQPRYLPPSVSQHLLQRQEKALEKDPPGHLSKFHAPGILDPLASTVPTPGFFGMVSQRM